MRLTALIVAFSIAGSIPPISLAYSLDDDTPSESASVNAGTSLSGSENGSVEDQETTTPVALTPPTADRSQKFTKHELCSVAASVAEANKLPVSFFANLIHQESGFKAHVVSPAGAQGIAQFMPRVAASYGLTNPFEPIAALAASGKLLADLIAQFGNLGLAAAAYNAGPKRVQDWMAQRVKLPAETRHYVRSITGLPAEHWARPDELKDTAYSLPPHAHCPDLPTMEAQGGEIKKPLAQTVEALSSPSGKASVPKIFVRRSMPQPSQFAMGLPVSRFAAIATPLIEKKAHDRRRSERAKLKPDLDILMRRFASMPTPTIMVEDKAAHRATGSGLSKKASRAGAPHVGTAMKQRMRVAAAQ